MAVEAIHLLQFLSCLLGSEPDRVRTSAQGQFLSCLLGSERNTARP